MAEVWNGRRVLVTGAGGFIGSHLVEALVERGASVRGFERYTSAASSVGDESPTDVEVVLGDLREPEAVRRAADGVDTVFHLGAEVAIPYSYVAPRQVVETNVLGTLNVLLAAHEAGVANVVCVST